MFFFFLFFFILLNFNHFFVIVFSAANGGVLGQLADIAVAAGFDYVLHNSSFVHASVVPDCMFL
jgi:hypothetical protein